MLIVTILAIQKVISALKCFNGKLLAFSFYLPLEKLLVVMLYNYS